MPKSADADREWAELLGDHVKQYSRDFFWAAYGFMKDEAAAEDVCQDALCKAWELRHAPDRPQRLRGWIHRVIINESLLRLRRRTMERRTLPHQYDTRAASSSVIGDGVDFRDSLMSAMQKLPENTRHIVVLRVMQDLSGNEVSAMLDCSPSEVSRQLRAGLNQLRELLGDWSHMKGGIAS